MILQIISFAFSVLWYTVILGIALIAALFLFLMVYFLKSGNDFPNKRRMCTSTRKLTGQTAVVTGSNTGIGFETAKDFAARGARVIMVCRNMQKAEAARSTIIASTGNENLVTMQCDVSDLESVQNFCKDFVANESALHILVNNAGVYHPRHQTKQKFHYTFGTNYVGPFLLTYLLLDLLKKSSPSRIINVASNVHYDAHQMGLLLEEDGIKFPQLETYEYSKLANVLHTKELARQLNGTGVTVYTLNPGFIYGGLPLNRSKSEETGILKTFVSYLMWSLKFTSITAEQGAQTTIFCAVDESVASDSGKYYDNCKVKEPNKLALDTDLARRLWNATLEVVRDYTKLSE